MKTDPMDMTTKPVRNAPVSTGPEFALPAARPTVIVAPELRGRRDFVVVREPDETDAEYQSRCDLFAVLLDHVEKG